MRNIICRTILGAVLLTSAASAVCGAQTPAAQASAKKKKKTTTSKSKKGVKPVGQKTPAPDRIREIQSALQKQGAYEGEPNGKWDDATVEAMKNYQDKNGLSPTGKIDALTLEKLGLGSGTSGKGAPIPAASTAAPASPAEQ